jgi:hypothetical protein
MYQEAATPSATNQTPQYIRRGWMVLSPEGQNKTNARFHWPMAQGCAAFKPSLRPVHGVFGERDRHCV